MLRCAFAVALVGCGFEPAAVTSGDGSTSIDAPPPCTNFGTGLQFCVDAPTMPLTLTDVIDTDHDPRCAAFTSTPTTPACVLAGTTIVVMNTVSATGSRPLVLVSSGDVMISGTLDVASHGASIVGASGDFATCTPGTPALTQSNFGGGGAGASFGGAGASGGNGDNGNGGAGGGPAAASNVPSVPRGGCKGSDGADGTGGKGLGGHGGGVAIVIARGNIQIDGAINASGSGGRGGSDSSSGGGGGGGSGGMVVLDAVSLALGNGGRIFANGGGGASGAGTASSSGDGGDPSGPTSSGAGGTPPGCGGNGGNGSSAMVGPQGGSNSSCGLGGGGGGGGGGGAGVVQVLAPTRMGVTSTNVAPPPS